MKFLNEEEAVPRLKELRDKRNEVFAKAAAHTAEITEIRARLPSNPNMGSARSNRVNEILGLPAIPDVSPDNERLGTLLSELRLHNEAMGILDCEIQKERVKASRIICEAAKPEHDKLASIFARKIIELHQAHKQYSTFVNSIDEKVTSITSLGRVSPYHLGSPKDPCGLYFYALHEFVDNGHLKKADLPQDFR